MAQQSKKEFSEKTQLHARNRHRARYDFEQLILACPELKTFVRINNYNNLSIDFADPQAVKTLNKALLQVFYGINNWDIPPGYLCPPIPGRADYIHYAADLLAASNNGIVPRGKSVHVLDVGVGANCVYPVIGNHEYDWQFTGSDVDAGALTSAKKIIAHNPQLSQTVALRRQANSDFILKNIIGLTDIFDLTVCNPPFHSSFAEAQEGTLRKQKNLGTQKNKKAVLNFGGQNNELWCKGGERSFVINMVNESAALPQHCFWYTSLISKSENLKSIYHALENANAVEVKTIEMAQGSKISRMVAWTFLNPAQQKEWVLKRWKK